MVGQGGLLPDRVMRTVGFRRIVEQEAALLNEPIKSTAEAYCAGINSWMDLAIHQHKLPIEFTLLGYQPEPWVPADILGFAKLMSWTLAGNWEAEFMRDQVTRRLGKEKVAQLEMDAENTWAAILDAAPKTLDPTRIFTGAGASDGVGSNNWVLHGNKTATGMPLLANDMHLEMSSPAIWFENHLVGGELEVSGVSIPGTFLITAGHTRHIAWGYTDGFNDVQDLYEEHLRKNPDGKVEYEFKGEWLPAEVRREEIRVKGDKPVVEEVVTTRHGPIINLLIDKDFPDVPPLAMKWTALEPEKTITALYNMNMAHDCAEFHHALELFSGPGQNTVYADTQGNIGYTLSGKTPIRAKGEGLVPVPGWTGEYEWTGYIPFDEMPHLENPSKGYVVTANNAHTREDGGHYISRDYCQADRAARIVELIEKNQKIDVAAIQKMQVDLVSPSARIMAHHLGRLKVSEDELKEIVSEFSEWDGKLNQDSAIAAIYEITIRRAIHLLLKNQLGDFGVHLEGKGVASFLWSNHTWEWFIRLLDTPDSPWFDLGKGEKRDDILKMALSQAVEELRKQLGENRNSWSWGQLHRLTFNHVLGAQKLLKAAFNQGSYPIGGDDTTIWAAAYPFATENNAIVGPPFRFIADLGNLDNCWSVLTPGQSGHPASPYYGDGIHPWLHGGYHPMLFRRDEVEKNLKARLDLLPGMNGPARQ